MIAGQSTDEGSQRARQGICDQTALSWHRLGSVCWIDSEESGLADYDIVVVGGGHNGLIAAAYVARAGLKVALLERSAHLGGAAAAVELWPGNHVDVGAGTRVVFCQTGIAEDFGLAEHGLTYLEFDPMFVAFFPDGTSIHFWCDLDRTCESIARLSPADAENYRRFVQTWTPIAPFFLDLFGSPPSLAGAARHMLAQLRRPGPRAFELLSGLAASPKALLRKYFSDPRLQSALAFSSAQTGVPTETRGSGASRLWFAMGHKWETPSHAVARARWPRRSGGSSLRWALACSRANRSSECALSRAASRS
jgi:phytoene dehydrogenase-like protein